MGQFDSASARELITAKSGKAPGQEHRAVREGAGVSFGGALRRWVGYVGLGATCCVLSVVSWRVFQSKFNNPISEQETFTTYTTRPGQRASLTLSDRSRVILGPSSTLRVQTNKASNSGVIVEVDGEALFSIAHAAQTPFVVTAHGVTTRVLGTEFVVRAYDVSLVRVVVRDGRVSVQSPIFTSNNVAIVNAGEAVSATPNALPEVAPIKDIATEFAWANGELVLKDVPLGEAFVRLSRWYGMEFRVSDAILLKKTVNMAFPSGFNQADIDVLGSVVKAHVRRSGNVISFSTVP